MAISRGVFLKDKLENEKVLEALRVIDDYYQDKYGIDTKEVLDVLREPTIPLSVFKNKLSSLENIVRYLKDIEKKSYSEIAKILKRDDRTIWCTYNNSLKKHPAPLKVEKSAIHIPLSVFSDRDYSVLESLVRHLKDEKKLSFNAISQALNRNYQTVWTTYRKARGKDE